MITGDSWTMTGGTIRTARRNSRKGILLRYAAGACAALSHRLVATASAVITDGTPRFWE
jgi:hypothetical protein